MATNKKKQEHTNLVKAKQDYVNLLKAIKNKDIKKIQICASAIDLQHRQIAYDIKEILTHNINYSKNQTRLKNQLANTHNKLIELQIQNEKLKIKKTTISAKQKLNNQIISTFQLFKKNKLQEAKSIIENPQLKNMILQLSQYRQLKLEFYNCKQNERPVELKPTSMQYKFLRSKLCESKAHIQQIHTLYQQHFERILSERERNFNNLYKIPQMSRKMLECIFHQLVDFKIRIRIYDEIIQSIPQKKCEWQKMYNQSVLEIQMMAPQLLENNSSYFQEEVQIIKDKSLLEQIRAKLTVIQDMINANFLNTARIMKFKDQKSSPQIQMLQKVINVLKSKQISQIKQSKNSRIKQNQEQIDLKVLNNSLHDRISELQKYQAQIRNSLVDWAQAIIDCQIENPLLFSDIQNFKNSNDEHNKIILQSNLGQLIKQFKKLKLSAKNMRNQDQLDRIQILQESKEVNSSIFKSRNGIFEEDQQNIAIIEQLNQQISELKKEIDQCNKSLQQKQTQIKGLKDYIKSFKTENSTLKQRLLKQTGKIKLIERQKDLIEKSLVQLSQMSILRPELDTAQLNQHNEKLNAQIQTLRKDLKQKQIQVQGYKKKELELSTEIQAKKQYTIKTQEYNVLAKSHSILKRKNEDMAKQIVELQSKVTIQRNEINQHISQIQRLNQMNREALNTPKQQNLCKICQGISEFQSSPFEKPTLQKIRSENLNYQSGHEALQQNQNLKKQLQQSSLKIEELERIVNTIKQQKQQQRKQISQAKLQKDQVLAIKKLIEQDNFRTVQRNIILEEQLLEQKKQISLSKTQIDRKTIEIRKLAQKVQMLQKLLKNANQNIQRKFEERNSSFRNDFPLQKARVTQHLFTAGDIFDQDYEEQRLQLVQKLEHYVRPIKKTKLIYKYDTINRVNFHKYIDDHKHIVLVIKTLYGKVIAAYSEQCFNSNGTKKGKAYLMALWNKRIYQVLKDKKGITYDDYFLIFGNSEIRIRSLQSKFFSNFGVGNSYFNNLGDKIEHLVGQKDRQVDMLSYQLYELQFE